jgi:hypothetical protein
MLSRYSHVRMGAKRRALGEIASRQRSRRAEAAKRSKNLSLVKPSRRVDAA